MDSSSGLSQRAHQAAKAPISYLMHKALAHPQIISLAAGFVDQDSLPAEAVGEIVAELTSDPVRARQALQYGTTEGYLPLREAWLDRHLAADGISRHDADVSLEQVIVTAGSNQLLHLICEALLDPGDIVVCAAPTYFVFVGAVEGCGARSLGVEADEQGINPESLDARLEQLAQRGELERVKAIYVSSYFDNPTSVTLAMDRRGRITQIARRWSEGRAPIYVIEDAAYRELRYSGEDVPSLWRDDPERVILTQTLSKCFSPGLRIGMGVFPRALTDPIARIKGNIDFGSPNLAQHVAAAALTGGHLDRQVSRLREVYSEKLAAMLEAADEHLGPLGGVSWYRPCGGLYVWVECPPEIDTGPDGPLFERCIDQGMLYVPGAYCYPSEGVATRHNTIRLSFGVQPPDRIRMGMAALARALAAAQGG